MIHKTLHHRAYLVLCTIVLVLTWTACGPSPDTDTQHIHNETGHSHEGHHHDPPHGGTVIRLGDELYHLEWVRDEAAGVMRCFILDGHMENFVRINQPAIEVEIQTPEDGLTSWTFVAAENRATGESVGNTSEFQAPLDELSDQNKFEGTIKEVHIQGNLFEKIPFQFPEGNEG